MLLRLFILLLCLTACAGNDSTPSAQTPLDGDWVVAWAETGRLMVWTPGDAAPREIASNGVVQPFIAPDGEHIAFTRGANGRAETLWVIDAAGQSEQQLAGPGQPDNLPAETLIGDVAWYDSGVLYFNTLLSGGMGPSPQNDLYRSTIQVSTTGQILAPGNGGRFRTSPDKTWIAIAYPGTYGQPDGHISVIDPLAEQPPRNLLTFEGVATGSETRFYPPLAWTPDSTAILTAIPDVDLIYTDAAGESIPPTSLWEIPVTDSAEPAIIGTVPASFFGLPRWSTDRAYMVYLQRREASNAFSIILAGRNGTEATTITQGEAGALALPQWLPDQQNFAYVQGEAGQVWLAGVDMESEQLSEAPILTPRFIGTGIMIYATPGDNGIELHYAHLNTGESGRIAAAGAAIPLFDAVLMTPG